MWRKEQRLGSFRDGGRALTNQQTAPVAIDSIELEKENRLLTDIQEFDRVLGGGLVPGTLVLIGGDPGIGKSTLMLQVLYGLANQGHKVLYVSGKNPTTRFGCGANGWIPLLQN